MQYLVKNIKNIKISHIKTVRYYVYATNTLAVCNAYKNRKVITDDKDLTQINCLTLKNDEVTQVSIR